MFKNNKYKHPYIFAKKIKAYLKKPSLIISHIKVLKLNKKLENQFIKALFDSKEEYNSYKKEILNSGLVVEINKKRNLYEKIVKGKNVSGLNYNMGAVNIPVGIRLYCLVRKYRPEILVETGVCNGVSTAFLLKAIDKNQKGKLHSIDYPEIEGQNYIQNEFWEGKGGAAIPANKTSGWVIPEHLKNNWELIVGKSQEKLPQLIQNIKQIDFFMHDSEHTYECMMFEFEKAYEILSENGFILSDNITSNNSFYDFCDEKGLIPFKFSQITGIALDRERIRG